MFPLVTSKEEKHLCRHVEGWQCFLPLLHLCSRRWGKISIIIHTTFWKSNEKQILQIFLYYNLFYYIMWLVPNFQQHLWGFISPLLYGAEIYVFQLKVSKMWMESDALDYDVPNLPIACRIAEDVFVMIDEACEL